MKAKELAHLLRLEQKTSRDMMQSTMAKADKTLHEALEMTRLTKDDATQAATQYEQSLELARVTHIEAIRKERSCASRSSKRLKKTQKNKVASITAKEESNADKHHRRVEDLEQQLESSILLLEDKMRE